jgi:O-methyltransferase involved in polyketide biosynthesis
MTRTDNDHWDLATSVGATSTMVAAARAAASRRADALINDAFAGPLVRAVGVELFTRIADGEFDDVACDAKQGPAIRRLVDVLAVRTRHFDRFLTEAAHSGNLANRDTRGRPRRAVVPIAVATDHDRLRGRSTARDRLQE